MASERGRRGKRLLEKWRQEGTVSGDRRKPILAFFLQTIVLTRKETTADHFENLGDGKERKNVFLVCLDDISEAPCFLSCPVSTQQAPCLHAGT